MKTNAARILDGLKVAYTLKSYEVDEANLDAVHVAKSCGEAIERVYKTIVCKAGGEFVVACLQGDLTLDLKALAKCAGTKSCELLPLKELTKVTGYVRGGCSPLGMKKQFRTFLDERILAVESVLVSAGLRGVQICLAPSELARATKAQICKIAF